MKDILKYKSKNCTDFASEVVDQNPYTEIHDNLKSRETSYVSLKEIMRGYVGGMPCTASLRIKINLQDQNCDDWNSVMRKSRPALKGKVRGYVVFSAIEKDKLHVIDGEIDMFEVDYRTPYTQYMHYRLLLAAASGSRYDKASICIPFDSLFLFSRKFVTLINADIFLRERR